MSFDDVWSVLEAASGDKHAGYVVRRVRPEAMCDLRLGVEKPSNTRLFLLRLNAASLRTPREFPKSSGFEVRRLFLPADARTHVTLSLRLTQPQFSEVFTSLVEDVSRHVAPATSDKAAIDALVERLERWQAFLKRHPAEGLSEESQRGLYGELRFLSEQAIPALGIRESVRAWTGPSGTNQDFEFGPVAVEVKVSTSKQHQKLMIASERQLDDTGLQNLLVYYLSLDVRQGGSDTLVAMVNRVRSQLLRDIVATQTFESSLFEAGYLECHASLYQRVGYATRETGFFRVGPGFPRIVEAMLPAGVGDVRYSISVAECKNYAITATEAVQLLGVTAHGD
jgi:hypothetical protein